MLQRLEMWISKFTNKYVWPIDVFKYKYLNNIKSERYFHKVIQHERERANRNNHQVSLAIFNLKSFPNDGKVKKQFIKSIFHKKRYLDEIGWYKKHSVGVILPYTSPHGAREFLVRIMGTLNFILPDSFCYLCTYPLEDSFDYNTESIAEGVEDLTDIKAIADKVGSL